MPINGPILTYTYFQLVMAKAGASNFILQWLAVQITKVC